MIQEIFKSKRLLADGGMGTILMDRLSLSPNEVLKANLLYPEEVLKIHEEYISAGSQLILTNSFMAHKIGLRKNGLEKHYLEIHQSLFEIIKTLPKNVIIGASIGPTGLGPTQIQSYTEKKLYENLHDQVELFLRSGLVHVLVFETISNLLELKIALKVIDNLPEDIISGITLSMRQDGMLYDETQCSYYASLIRDSNACFTGLNCCLEPSAMFRAFHAFKNKLSDQKIMIKFNAGMPIQKNERWRYPVDSEEFSEQLEEFIFSGVDIVGGCCGTTPEYIQKIKAQFAF